MGPPPAKRRRIADPHPQAEVHGNYARGDDGSDGLAGSTDPIASQRRSRHRRDILEVAVPIDKVINVEVQVNSAGVATATSTAVKLTTLANFEVSVGVPLLSSVLAAATSTTLLTSTPNADLKPLPAAPTSSTGTTTSPIQAPSPSNAVAVIASIESSLGLTTPVLFASTATTSPSTAPIPTTTETSATNTSSSVSSTAAINEALPTGLSNSTSPFTNSTSTGTFTFKNSTATALNTTSNVVRPSTSSFLSSAFTSTSLTAPTSAETTGSSALLPGVASTGSGNGGSSNTHNSNNNENNNNGANATPPIASPPVIAGAVTGSVGAAAIVFVIIFILLRWYRTRLNKKTILTGDMAYLHDAASSSGGATNSTRERSSGFIPAAAMSWISRHHRLPSSPTLPPALSLSPSGFQKLSGRKLPSQFDPEPTGAPLYRDFTDPTAAGHTAAYLSPFSSSTANRSNQSMHRSMYSDLSAYRESRVSYIDENGLGRNTRQQRLSSYERPERETMMPGPARRPVIQQGMYFLPPEASYAADGDAAHRQGQGQGRRVSRFAERISRIL